jgi:hypothetical protein
MPWVQSVIPIGSALFIAAELLRLPQVLAVAAEPRRRAPEAA